LSVESSCQEIDGCHHITCACGTDSNTGEDLDDEDRMIINKAAKKIIKNVSDRIDTKNICSYRLNEICSDYGQK
jgi:hypothetical protein